MRGMRTSGDAIGGFSGASRVGLPQERRKLPALDDAGELGQASLGSADSRQVG
jgi:hypothetical protein